jgi:RimJ/RimL family protein N-acetyltransferase
VIETEQLFLRAWRPADREPFAAMNADPEVMRYVGPHHPLTRAQSDDLLARIEAHWREHGYGPWCAAPRARPDACLGLVGLALPPFLPKLLPAVEVGWRFARGAWGHGYATEGARAALGHAFGPLGLASVISIIEPDNLRSLRVAERLGMRRRRDLLHPAKRRQVCLYEISAEDAASSQRGVLTAPPAPT